MTIQLKRGTRARVNLTASQRGFLTGEPLLITDENRLAVATSPSTYTTFLKEGEGGGGTTDIAATTHAAGTKTTPVDTDEFPLVDSASSWGLKKLTFANLKTWIGGLFVSKSGDTINGSLICGNGQTAAYPPAAIAANPTTHATSKRAAISVGAWLIGQDFIGNGTRDFFLYDTLVGTLRLRIEPTTGNVLVTSGALGYGVGAGGTVVQATSKSTAVTLNKPSGRIVMNNASLNASTSVSFVFNNSLLTGIDGLVLNVAAGASANSYVVQTGQIDPGLAVIHVRNISVSNLSEAVSINFQIIKGATS